MLYTSNHDDFKCTFKFYSKISVFACRAIAHALDTEIRTKSQEQNESVVDSGVCVSYQEYVICGSSETFLSLPL